MIMNSFLLILNFLHLNVNFDRFHHGSPISFFEFRAYDKAAIRYNGREAVTNFVPSTYGEGTILEANDRSTILFCSFFPLNFLISCAHL